METNKKITEKIVEMVMRDRPKSRDSDETLCKILVNMGYREESKACYFYNAVTRWRRNIQKKGLYPAIEPVGKRRKQLAECVKEEYTPTKKDIQEQVLQHLVYRQQTICSH